MVALPDDLPDGGVVGGGEAFLGLVGNSLGDLAQGAAVHSFVVELLGLGDGFGTAGLGPAGPVHHGDPGALAGGQSGAVQELAEGDALGVPGL